MEVLIWIILVLLSLAWLSGFWLRLSLAVLFTACVIYGAYLLGRILMSMAGNLRNGKPERKEKRTSSGMTGKTRWTSSKKSSTKTQTNWTGQSGKSNTVRPLTTYENDIKTRRIANKIYGKIKLIIAILVSVFLVLLIVYAFLLVYMTMKIS